MENQVLGNRYELIEKIGGGGMAVVYKAKCRLLNRFVAVKILRPDFINDEEFVKRFRVEAQAAASLSHPNIVSIYDVGHEDEYHYIVMEYVDGITLKEYITQKKALNWKEATGIALQICSAIEQAHRRHIVHRDIKPHNILITKDGIAKVTDFGIAKAVTSSTITMVGSTIGSVHYFSPEQARGGYTDEKSDLYSLGIVLYEMVTGKIPFDAETPVAVALKHIQDQAVQPMDLNPDISNGINDIIMKAIRKDMGTRYQTASEMLEDLHRVLKEPGMRLAAVDERNDSPTVRIQDINSILESEHKEESAIGSKKGTQKNKKNEKLTVWLAVATSVVIIAVLAIIGYQLIKGIIQPEQENFIVGNYIGKNIYEVKAELDSKGIKVTENYIPSNTYAKDVIIDQKVKEGFELKVDGFGTIELDVSSGPDTVVIPDLRLQQSRIAEADLQQLKRDNKIQDYRVEEEYSDEVGQGLVIRTDPAGNEEVPTGVIVTIYKSMGPQLAKVRVPKLIGLTESEAKAALMDANLKIGRITPKDVSSSIAKVIEQYPKEGTEVDEESAVDIKLDIVNATPNSGQTGTIEDNPTGIQGGVSEEHQASGQEEVQQNGTAGNDENASSGQRKVYNMPVNLENPEKYGDKIKVRVEVIPSDTNKVEVVCDREAAKTEFPVTVQVPIPEGGTTVIKIFFDNKGVNQFSWPQ